MVSEKVWQKKAMKAKQIIPLYNLPTSIHTKSKDFLIGNHCGKRSVNLLSTLLKMQLFSVGRWRDMEYALWERRLSVVRGGHSTFLGDICAPPSCEAEWRPRTGILGGCVVVALITIKQPSALMCLLGVHMPLRIETMGQNARSFQLRYVI